MKLLPIAAACLLAFPAQAVLAQAAPAPVSEAVIDAFLASLPENARPAPGPVEPDPEILKVLGELNPGKEAQVAAILGAFDRCAVPAVAAGTERLLRTVARGLGAEKLRRMTDFFSGPDLAVMNAVEGRIEKSAKPAAADLAERERLLAAYPLVDFIAAMSRSEEIAASDQIFIAAVTQCGDQRNAALAKAGIKTPS